ncbi:hypothetical protein C8J57DRAFT_1249782 [Mycena rebaudengoi]|nr:hypothetical protein C8J57DRAFT_1249782 [Mycena rebaudengoi]
MQFNVVFITAALVASAPLAMSAILTGFAGAGCTGASTPGFNVAPNQCFSFGSGSAKSISYSGVPSEIEFFISGGGHDSCSNGPSLILGGGSGCSTAPSGVNWESAAFA